MPKYDYRCETCGQVEEINHSMDEDYNGLECAHIECDGHITKMFTAPAVRFKGQGWGGVYRTYKPKKDS